MITVVTPTIPGREHLLQECIASVSAAGFDHLVGVDVERLGPAAMRNRLLREVTTPWVLWLDDDDILFPQYYQGIRSSMDDSDVIYTSWYLQGADTPLPCGFDADRLRRGNYIPVTAACRTEAVLAVGGFPEDWVLEDHGLWIRLLDAGYRFTYVPVIGWVYRRQPGSRTETG